MINKESIKEVDLNQKLLILSENSFLDTQGVVHNYLTVYVDGGVTKVFLPVGKTPSDVVGFELRTSHKNSVLYLSPVFSTE